MNGNNITLMEKNMKSFIKACNDAFLDENPLDPVDINIIENYSDFIIERLEILFNKMRGSV